MKPPSLDDVAAMAEAAWAALPPAFQRMAGDVLIRIEDFAEDEILKDFGMESPFELSGLYVDRKSTRLNSSHIQKSRMPSSA